MSASFPRIQMYCFQNFFLLNNFLEIIFNACSLVSFKFLEVECGIVEDKSNIRLFLILNLRSQWAQPAFGSFVDLVTSKEKWRQDVWWCCLEVKYFWCSYMSIVTKHFSYAETYCVETVWLLAACCRENEAAYPECCTLPDSSGFRT